MISSFGCGVFDIAKFWSQWTLNVMSTKNKHACIVTRMCCQLELCKIVLSSEVGGWHQFILLCTHLLHLQNHFYGCWWMVRQFALASRESSVAHSSRFLPQGPISCLAMTSVTFCSRITYFDVLLVKSELKSSMMRTNSDFGGKFQVHVGRATPNFGFEKSSWSWPSSGY